MKSLFYLLIFFCASCSCRELPPSFKRCNAKSSDFNECLTEAIPDAVRQLTSDFKQIGLPPMQPLTIRELTVAPGHGLVGFHQNYTNLRVLGFTNISCSRIELDQETKILTMNCSTPWIRADFNYLFNGTVSSLPICGNGTGWIVLDNVKCFHTFNLEEYKRKNKLHLKVINSSLEINPEHVSFRFENLYDGEKNLGSNINLFMNENWKDVYEESRFIYETAFTRVFAALFNSVLKRVPVDNLFKGW